MQQTRRSPTSTVRRADAVAPLFLSSLLTVVCVCGITHLCNHGDLRHEIVVLVCSSFGFFDTSCVVRRAWSGFFLSFLWFVVAGHVSVSVGVFQVVGFCVEGSFSLCFFLREKDTVFCDFLQFVGLVFCFSFKSFCTSGCSRSLAFFWIYFEYS